jgi:beta-N-acetylglucosaminidase
MTKEEKLVEKMKDLLEEVSDLNDEDITDANYRDFYENAANELNLYDGEDEDGESDIYRFTYDYLDEYVGLRNELVKLLKEKGLTLEQRKEFYKLNLC